MHDGVSLESLGVPTAVIVTTEFVHEAKVQCVALGMKDLIPVVIQHPMSSLTEEEIRARAVAALPQLVAVWTGKLPNPSGRGGPPRR